MYIPTVYYKHRQSMFLIYSEDVLFETFVWGPNLISLHIKGSLKDNNIYVVKTDGKEG